MKVALIGAGGIGEAHSNAYLLMEDVKIAFVVDPVKENADKLAKVHGAKAYYSLDDLLANEKPDMVDICVPSYLHKEVAIKCMDAKIHTLCEKPIANKMEDALEMMEAYKRNGVLFMIAQVVRFMPEYVYLKKLCDNGDYGKLLHASFSRMCQAPIWGSGWYTDTTKSGLAPFELHIHDEDFIHYLLGLPKEVNSIGFDHPENHNSYVSTRYVYEDGLTVQAEGGWYSGPLPFFMEYMAIFDKAVIQFKDNTVMVYPKEGEAFKAELENVVNVTSDINLKNAGGMYNEIRYFIDCIRNGKPIEVVTPEQSIGTLDMLLKELESRSTGNAVKIYNYRTI